VEGGELVDGLLELGGREWDGDGDGEGGVVVKRMVIVGEGEMVRWEGWVVLRGSVFMVVACRRHWWLFDCLEGTIWGVMACLDARRWMKPRFYPGFIILKRTNATIH
jgi:hypothetical protein